MSKSELKHAYSFFQGFRLVFLFWVYREDWEEESKRRGWEGGGVAFLCIFGAVPCFPPMGS